MSVADTSIDAYREHRDAGRLSAQQKTIMLFFHSLPKGGDFTRSEIAQATGLRLSSVCGRVFELVDMGYLVECPRRPCTVTGTNAHPLKIPPRQMELLAA